MYAATHEMTMIRLNRFMDKYGVAYSWMIDKGSKRIALAIVYGSFQKTFKYDYRKEVESRVRNERHCLDAIFSKIEASVISQIQTVQKAA